MGQGFLPGWCVRGGCWGLMGPQQRKMELTAAVGEGFGVAWG